jgi:hypothetical protein
MINVEQIPKSELRNLARELLLAVQRSDKAEEKVAAAPEDKRAITE